MLADLRKVRFPAETALLFILCLSLPIFEAPKNLAWVAYVVVWAVNRLRTRDFGGRWDLWDTLIALWIASGYVVAAFAGFHDSEWGGAGDLLRYGSVLWLVKRGGYSAREIRWMVGALVASTVIGLAYGYWRMWSGIGKSGVLQLHSVGHVNHTAIYLAIMLGVCAAWLFTRWRVWRLGTRAVAAAVTTLVLVSLVVTASRGAVGVGLALLPLLALAWWPRWRTPFILSAAAVVVVVGVAFALSIDVVRKQQENEAAQNVLSFRDGIWRMGLAGWERFPVFGVGMDNFKLITHERIKAWRTEAGQPYDASRYVHFPHGHNLYINTLAERGAVGFAILAAVLLAWAVWLVRFRPRREDEDLDWLLWGGAAAGWFVTLAAGTVNTTLHHEHALLAVLLLGLWLSRRTKPRAS
jgi:O-antigen ligase